MGENQHGVNAHKDAAFLTLLLPDGPGLEIQLFDGRWVPVEVVEGAFVINLGEALQSLTGNYFVATHIVSSLLENVIHVGFFKVAIWSIIYQIHPLIQNLLRKYKQVNFIEKLNIWQERRNRTRCW